MFVEILYLGESKSSNSPKSLTAEGKKKRGGSKPGTKKRHLAAAKKLNDPALNPKYNGKVITMDEMDQELMRLSKSGKIFWINEYFNEDFKATIKRSKISPAWAFCVKAKFPIYVDSKTNKPTKYGTSQWYRCKCTLCDYRCTCESATTIITHLTRDHKIDAQGFEPKLLDLYCEATGFSKEELTQDPETIESQATILKLIEKYRIDTHEYDYSNMKPQSLHRQPEEIQKMFHEYLIELLVGVNATPTSANKRVVARYIDVCNLYFMYFCGDQIYIFCTRKNIFVILYDNNFL